MDGAAAAAPPTLDQLRTRIDECDRQLVRLLNDRLAVCREIGHAKDRATAQLSPGARAARPREDVYQPTRELAVFEKVTALNAAEAGPLTDAALRAVYREVMSASIALQRETTVAFLGPLATYTHQAAVSRFGASISCVPHSTIPDVFAAVQSGATTYGVVPIENSTEGSVTYTLDCLAREDFAGCFVYAEIILDIEHALLGRSGLAGVRRVLSHPQALAQTRGWLRANLPDAELVEVSSTSRAAEIAAAEGDAAAVCSVLASDVYGVPVIQESIQDMRGNQSRFIVLGRKADRPTGDRDKTFLLLTLSDRPGALHAALSVFERHGVNLLKIESRPSRVRKWHCVFHIDLDGHATAEHVRACVAELGRQCESVRILGSCARAV